jgi:hypothetical protein
LGCHYIVYVAGERFSVRIPNHDVEIVVWLLIDIQSAAVPVPVQCPAGLHRYGFTGYEQGAIPNLDPRFANPLGVRDRIKEVSSIVSNGELKLGGRALLRRLAKAGNTSGQADTAEENPHATRLFRTRYAVDVTAVRHF